jgi:hypothetical protein
LQPILTSIITTDVSEKCTAPIFRVEGVSTFIRNIGINLPDKTASRSRRHYSIVPVERTSNLVANNPSVRYLCTFRARTCEHDNEPSGARKGGQLLDQMNEYWLPKKEYAPWNSLRHQESVIISVELCFYEGPGIAQSV